MRTFLCEPACVGTFMFTLKIFWKPALFPGRMPGICPVPTMLAVSLKWLACSAFSMETLKRKNESLLCVILYYSECLCGRVTSISPVCLSGPCTVIRDLQPTPTLAPAPSGPIHRGTALTQSTLHSHFIVNLSLTYLYSLLLICLVLIISCAHNEYIIITTHCLFVFSSLRLLFLFLFVSICLFVLL